MGNKAKPTTLKVLQGTARKDRSNPSEPKAVAGALVAPDYLTELQASEFNRLASMVGEIMMVAGRSDADALAQLAITLEAIAIDNQLLADPQIGPYYAKDDGTPVAHPATRRIIANQQRAQALMNEFGLTPASRSKVSAMGKADENPFAAIGNGKRA
jgi:P27 family predicted phage terminase small subunit